LPHKGNVSTAHCGRRPPRPPAARATPPRSWAHRRPSPPRDYCDLGVDIFPRGAMTCSATRSTSAVMITIVREEVAKRDADAAGEAEPGQPGRLGADRPYSGGAWPDDRDLGNVYRPGHDQWSSPHGSTHDPAHLCPAHSRPGKPPP
jgi:hypothetical protein